MRVMVLALGIVVVAAGSGCGKPSLTGESITNPRTVAIVEAAEEAGRRFSRAEIFGQLKGWDSAARAIDEVHLYTQDGVTCLSVLVRRDTGGENDAVYRLVYTTEDEQHFRWRNAGDKPTSLGRPPDMTIKTPNQASDATERAPSAPPEAPQG